MPNSLEAVVLHRNAVETTVRAHGVVAVAVFGSVAACIEPNETALDLVVRSEPELRGISYMAALDDIEAAVEAVIGFTIDAIGEADPSAEAAHRIPLFTPSSEPTQSLIAAPATLAPTTTTRSLFPVPLRKTPCRAMRHDT
jgi:predicted nucleotidyltransferase